DADSWGRDRHSRLCVALEVHRVADSGSRDRDAARLGARAASGESGYVLSAAAEISEERIFGAEDAKLSSPAATDPQTTRQRTYALEQRCRGSLRTRGMRAIECRG